MATSKRNTGKSAAKAPKKPAKKSASKSTAKSGTPAKRAAGKGAKKSAKGKAAPAASLPAGKKIFQVPLRPLKDLRAQLKPLAETPRDMTAAEVGALATNAFTVIDEFLDLCGGSGGGGSDQKLNVIR